MRKSAGPLAFHGVTIRARDPEALARRCRELLSLPLLRRRRGRVILGAGPELFVAIRRARAGEPEGVEEIHLAVEEIARTRRKTSADELGGDSWSRDLMPTLALIVRQFRRPPSRTWSKKRLVH